MVPPLAFFGTSVALSFVAWGIIAARYLWPALRHKPRARALRPLLLLHSFRFIGLAFLVPGVVSPNLPGAFAIPAAYGDRCRSPGLARAGGTPEQAGNRLGLGVQPLG